MGQCAGIIAEINRANEGVQQKNAIYKVYSHRLVEEKEKNLYVIRAEHSEFDIGFAESDIDSTEKQISSDAQAKTKAMHRLRDQPGSKGEIEPTYPRVRYPDSDDLGTRKKLRTHVERIEQEPSPLLPEKRGQQGESESQDKSIGIRPFRHSDDFRSVGIDGKKFTFTQRQADVIRYLYEAKQAGTPDVGSRSLVKKVSPQTTATRLKDIFRTNPGAYKLLIEKGDRKGTVRLKI